MSLSPFGFQSVESLEQFLGSSWNSENTFSFKRSIELDEKELFPSRACEQLDQWGLSDYYVPEQYGGKIRDYGELLALLRTLARRDLTVAIAHCKTYLGAVPVWVGGSREQKQLLSHIVRRGEPVSLGLTERAHGSDLLASEVQAIPAEGGFRLSGEKWLINNGRRSSAMTVFARTDARGGPRGFSLFMVEKGKLDPSSYAHLTKIKTLGVRGADISGIVFKDSLISNGALIGPQGAGLEITLKALQVTRTLVPGLSLGAADTALRVTLDFATSRILRGGKVFDIPYAQSQMTRAFLDLLICECLMIAGARALHAIPSQMSIWSAVIKYFVPTTIDETLHQLSIVLGARHYLRQEHAEGIFQKFLRDHRLVGIFDGNTSVNLNLISQQLRHLSEMRRKSQLIGKGSLRSLFSFREPLPDFDPGQLELSCRGQDVVLQGLSATLSTLNLERAGLDESLIEALKAGISDLDRDIDRLVTHCGSGWHQSAEIFQLSKRYGTLFAAAVCVHVWAHNSAPDLRGSLPGLGPFFQQEGWVSLCLEHLLAKIDPSRGVIHRRRLSAKKAEVAAELLSQFQQNQLFSIAPFTLAETSLRRKNGS